jgi:uncharacterized protein (TIRG00374 family)
VLVAVPGLGYVRGFIERQVGFLVSNAIPGGGAVAVGTQIGILNSYRVPASLSAAAVSADAVWTYLLTLGMPSLGVALLVLVGGNSANLITLAAIGLAAVLVSVAVLAIMLRSRDGARWVGSWGTRLVTPALRLFHRQPPDLAAAAVRFHDTAAELVSTKWPALTLTNVAAQSTPFVVLLCALSAVGALPDRVSVIEAFAAYSVATLLTSFPLTPGGLGTVDVALIGLLVAFGASSTEAAAADVLWRMVWFLPQLLAGAVSFLAYLLGRRRRRGTTQHPESA